jgi:muconate cycloisomerase
MGVNRTPRFSALLLAGLDMALWDLAGKILKLPVYQLLGGAYHQAVDYFAFPQGDSAHELAAASQKAMQKGYSVVYVKVGRGEKKDLENVAAVRENIGDRRLRLDANGAWDPVTAVRMIRLLSSYDPEFIEQPTPPHSLAALKQVRESVSVSIAADQSVFTIEEIYEVCRQQAADLLVFSPHETGGLTAFKKGAAIAAAAGLRVCLHGQFTSGISDSAQHQAALNTPNLYDGNQIMHQLLEEDLISSPCIEPQNGKLGIWKTPGLGFELNRDAVARAAERYRTYAAGAHKLVT